jgi:hypothetical protein
MASENVGKPEKAKTNTSINSFANDGSFFEIYKQRLKEQEKVPDEKKDDKTENEKRKMTNLLLQV